MTDKDRAIPPGRAVVNGAGQAVSAVPASVPIAEIAAFREAFIACWRAAIAWAYSQQVRKGHTAELMAARLGWSVQKLERLMVVPRSIKLNELAEICWSMHCEPTLDTIDGKIAVCVTPIAELMERHAQGIEAGTGETEGLDPKDESPVAKPCAHPDPGSDDDRRRG